MELEPCERIEVLISKLQMSQSDFAKSIEVGQATLSKMFRTKTKPGFATIYGIAVYYPEVNIEWIIKGEGNIFKSKEVVKSMVSDQDVSYQLNEMQTEIEALKKRIDEK